LPYQKAFCVRRWATRSLVSTNESLALVGTLKLAWTHVIEDRWSGDKVRPGTNKKIEIKKGELTTNFGGPGSWELGKTLLVHFFGP
jgi:hypothetical protein